MIILPILLTIMSYPATDSPAGEMRLVTCLAGASDINVPQRLLADSIGSRWVKVKTNAIPWGAAVINIEGEAEVAPKISIAMPVMWCPWFIRPRRAIRVIALQPEGRWWLRHAGTGHFFGLHFSMAWFNIRYDGYRYQDKGRPALGGGLTYGYALTLGNSWTLDFSIGAGVVSMKYDRFHNTVNGSLIDTRLTTYWGIDHAAISIAYKFEI